MQPDTSRVLLVGAGPGAADLLTLRALRALEQADVVLADALVSDDVRALIPPATRIIEVGKRGHRPSTPQDFINRLMLRLARAGQTVARLKGGDPSIFGRSGEERAFLEARGVAVEVVPGVTTASAAAAEFGFSLTTRAGARRVLFATGRTLEGASADLAADAATTICLYMGCADIAAVSADLIAAGLSPATAAIATMDVSRPTSRLIPSTLANLPAALAGETGSAPVFIAIGAACAAAVSARAPQAAFPPVAVRPAC
jgi:uroporphyrin-III C-methyltransferase